MGRFLEWWRAKSDADDGLSFSSNEVKAASSDRVGDALERRLWLALRDVSPLRRVDSLVAPLVVYEDNGGALYKLVHTGHVVRLVQRAHRWLDSVTHHPSLANEWKEELRQEREDRVVMYLAIVENNGAFVKQLQLETKRSDHEEYCLELLTLLRHDVGRHEELLLPAEKHLLSIAYVRLMECGNIVTVSNPGWFESPLELTKVPGSHWYRGAAVVADFETPSDATEEIFVTQAALWSSLNHPQIVKLFGGCHVGKRFYLHDQFKPTEELGWSHFYQCVLALQYLHDRGLSFPVFKKQYILKNVLTGSAMLHGAGVILSRYGEAPIDNVASDLRAFAKGILACCVPDDKIRWAWRIPWTRWTQPPFLSREKWAVLNEMYHANTMDPTLMTRIVHQLRSQLMVESDEDCPPTQIPPGLYLRDVPMLVAASRRTLGDVFGELQVYFSTSATDPHEMDRHVYQRLAAVYDPLQGILADSLSSAIVDTLCNIVPRFYSSTVQQSTLSYCSASSMSCAARTIAGRNFTLHHDIDRLLALPEVEAGNPIHAWKDQWTNASNQQRQNGVTTSSALVCIAEDTITFYEQEEAAVLTTFEATKRQGAYNPEVLQSLEVAESRLAEAVGSAIVPEWFIPAYEVELGEFISEGSFGAVYKGKWFCTDVVVKVLLSDTPEQRQEFVREADIWFTLNHSNVIHLFGACHVGPRPLFVCEFASGGTLEDYSKTSGPKDWWMWLFLTQAALGLQYLKERGIVHGDLKGNNILIVGQAAPTGKLTDFGLSRFLHTPDEKEAGALGAYRWKAPEVLKGERPTFASDMFGLGMCIIEAATGRPPWCNVNDDVIVKTLVKRGQLPERLDCFDDDAWELVTRMCCFEPSERIDIRVAVQLLTTINDRYFN